MPENVVICRIADLHGQLRVGDEPLTLRLADVSLLPDKTGMEKAMQLLTKTEVASVPGEAFFHGADGSDLIRFSLPKYVDLWYFYYNRNVNL